MPMAGSAPAAEQFALPSPDVMREIYADTMNNTLVEQAQEGHINPGHHPGGGGGGMSIGGAGDRFAAAASQHSPEQLFPGAAGNWASLAFDK